MGENIIKLIKPADIITLFCALLGFSSIIMTFSGQPDAALVLILAAVIADAADGAVARYSGCGVLGANLDSLADIISFGVAPAVAALVFLKDLGALAWVSAGFFLVCGVLRLARFNVAGKKDGFEGIPITSGGFIAALFLLVRDHVPYASYAFVILLFIVSLLMVSTISYPKLKNPVILAPMGILLVLDIVVFYLDYPDIVKIASLILLVFVLAYILSPLRGIFYDRDQ
ncbi:MAG: CDP-diacylglycerol--serine O-phosphatidyltransferase [Euryarchaeota archaeon]|nr:CDP-diacylglycerol--serine O-phosphatidyltransferase [Euryarchaeota archaeon]MBU4138599.1 CDP-diacylglycerol--serine O-phosphatidyltransferase [Euryarchaeota archaeon]